MHSISTYDLIIIDHDRIIFHDYRDSPTKRLQLCIDLLTNSKLSSKINASEFEELIQSLNQDIPDKSLDIIAKYCRRWNLHIYASTTEKIYETKILKATIEPKNGSARESNHHSSH